MSFSVKEKVSYYSKIEDAVLNWWSTLNTDTVLSNILDIEWECNTQTFSIWITVSFEKKMIEISQLMKMRARLDFLQDAEEVGGQSLILLTLSRKDEVWMMER